MGLVVIDFTNGVFHMSATRACTIVSASGGSHAISILLPESSSATSGYTRNPTPPRRARTMATVPATSTGVFHFPEPARRFFVTFFADDLPVRAGGRRDSSESSSSDAGLSAAARSANSSSSGGSSTTNGLLHLGQGIFLPAAPRFLS